MEAASNYESGVPDSPGPDEVGDGAPAQLFADGLNPPQRAAVEYGDGPLLVIAGAGSGKTRVLTHRIVHLLGTRRARPGEILAITFTNRAATEMRERVEELIGSKARAMWVTTFHSACGRMLRGDAEKLGYARAFTIYDEADSIRMIKRVMDELDVDPKRFPARAIKNAISGAKNELIDPDAAFFQRFEYTGVSNSAHRRGLNLIGIEMDRDGILPDALAAAIERHRPKALYLNPTLQNPTTLTIPTERRLAISEVLNKHGLPLIEDDAYGFIPSKAPAPIAVSAPDLTWHIGGLAKCIGAGLRLAYTIAPTGKLAYSLGQTLKIQAVMASPITTALATQWIEDGTADKIRRFIRSETSARQAIAREVLEGFDFQGAENAFNIWLSLPEGIGRADVVARMAGRPIGIMPSDAFSVGITPGDQVRLCLGGSLSREDLRASLYFLVNSLQHSAFLG